MADKHAANTHLRENVILSPLKVCHFLEASGAGVLGVVLDSVKSVNERFPGQIEYTIVFSRREETPADLREANPSIRFIEVKVGRVFFSWNDVRLLFRLHELFSVFDVVHCHSSRAGFLGRLLGRFMPSTRFFYSPHCYAFLSEEFSAAKRMAIKLVEMVLARFSGATTIACGDSEYGIAKALGGPSVLVRNGVDGERYANALVQSSTRPNDGSILVVGSGRDSIQKDPVLFRDIATRFGSKSIQFLWIGSHPDSTISTGWIDRTKAREILESCDIFLSTSRWEGLPLTGLEAMALGKPLVVRDRIGFRDLVEHGKNGFLFERAEEAVKEITRLVHDPLLRKKLGRVSLDIVGAKYQAANYLALHSLYFTGSSKPQIEDGKPA